MKKTDKSKALKSKLKVDFNKKNIIVISAVVVLVFLSFIVYGMYDAGFFTAYSDTAGGDSSVISDNKSVKFTGNDIITVESFSSKMFVLTEKLLVCLEPNGDVRYTKVHNYSNPAVSISGKYGVLFNRNSQEYMIFTSKGIVFEGRTEEELDILTASVNSDGAVALSTKSNDSACRVYLYNKKGEKKYAWSCGEEYVVCLDISSNSKKIVCGAIGAEKGEILSKTYLLDIFKDTAQCEFDEKGNGIVSVKLKGKKIVSVFLDERLIYDTLSAKGAAEKSKYASSALCTYTDSSGNSAVVTESLSGFGTSDCTVYTDDNKVMYTVSVDGKGTDVILKGKKAYIACDDTVYETAKGEVKNSFEADFNIKGIVICKGKVFVYSSGILTRLR